MGRHKQRAPFTNPQLKRPPTLAGDAAEVFDYLVRCVDPHHFNEVDAPLVQQYAESIINARKAQEAIDRDGPVTASGKVSPWCVVLEKSHRSCVALALRLRLSPQSRFDRLVAGTNSRRQNGRQLWADEVDPDDPENLLARPERPKTGLAAFRKPTTIPQKLWEASPDDDDDDDDRLLA